MKDAFPGDASFYKVRSWETEAKKIMRCHRGWITFIAVEDGEVVGVIAARHLKCKAMPTVRMEWLRVHFSQRGKGLGKALMDYLMDWIEASFPESKLRLTLRARTGVQNFYRGLGFRHYGSGWMKMVAKK